mmetsp:Transcript_9459/g.21628  ORF Transcript_9459/g.21628 Transcript_9459/m.21628 type:complete len:408 (+) Transcript_9459:734-1957(+)
MAPNAPSTLSVRARCCSAAISLSPAWRAVRRVLVASRRSTSSSRSRSSVPRTASWARPRTVLEASRCFSRALATVSVCSRWVLSAAACSLTSSAMRRISRRLKSCASLRRSSCSKRATLSRSAPSTSAATRCLCLTSRISLRFLMPISPLASSFFTSSNLRSIHLSFVCARSTWSSLRRSKLSSFFVRRISCLSSAFRRRWATRASACSSRDSVRRIRFSITCRFCAADIWPTVRSSSCCTARWASSVASPPSANTSPAFSRCRARLRAASVSRVAASSRPTRRVVALASFSSRRAAARLLSAYCSPSATTPRATPRWSARTRRDSSRVSACTVPMCDAICALVCLPSASAACCTVDLASMSVLRISWGRPRSRSLTESVSKSSMLLAGSSTETALSSAAVTEASNS